MGDSNPGAVPGAYSSSTRAIRDGQEGEGSRDGPRERDPPPGYDGADSEGTFKAFEKAVRLAVRNRCSM